MIDDYAFQAKLVVLLVKNPETLRSYRPALSEELFEFEDHRSAVRAILSYYDSYGKSPDWSDLRTALKISSNGGPNSPEDWSRYVKALRTVSRNGTELSMVQDLTEKFIRLRVRGQALQTMVEAYRAGEVDDMDKAYAKASKYQVTPVEGINFFEDPFARLSIPYVREPITTGIRSLDLKLGGGPARSELTVVLAATGTGKTTALVNFGAGAVLAGFKVHHFFYESRVDFLWVKYACRFSRSEESTLRSDPTLYAKYLEKLAKQKGGELRIASCLGWKVDTMRAYAYRHGIPDLVIVDYPDKLVSTRRYNEFRHEIAAVYDELIAFGKEFNCSLLAASQTNKQALNKTHVNLDDVGEAYAKMQIADNVIALAQNKKERLRDELRLVLAKVRNLESGVAVPCRTLFSRCLLYSADDYTVNVATGGRIEPGRRSLPKSIDEEA